MSPFLRSFVEQRYVQNNQWKRLRSGWRRMGRTKSHNHFVNRYFLSIYAGWSIVSIFVLNVCSFYSQNRKKCGIFNHPISSLFFLISKNYSNSFLFSNKCWFSINFFFRFWAYALRKICVLIFLLKNQNGDEWDNSMTASN